MRSSWRKIKQTTSVIRYEIEAPVEVKDLEIVLTWVRDEFRRLNGRHIENDNDYWLEPMDDHVAFCFRVEEKRDISLVEES